jgi:hypothetical protein
MKVVMGLTRYVPQITRGCVTLWPCHFTLKNILRQKKNDGNSNISASKKYNLQENPLKESKILQDISYLYN